MKLYQGLPARNAHRMVWHSLPDRQRWAELLNRINLEWDDVERQSVLEGLRPCTLQPLSKGKYLEILPWAFQNGLAVRAVRTVKAWQGFANHYEAGDDYVVTAIANDPAALDKPEDHLGYPLCCQRFFANNFPRGLTDPVWQWATGTDDRGATTADVVASPYADPTLRYNNIRFSPHIPCRPDCAESIVLGQNMASLMNPELRDARLELFAAPHSWDCYRGLLITIAAPFRIISGSLPTTERYLVNVVSH